MYYKENLIIFRKLSEQPSVISPKNAMILAGTVAAGISTAEGSETLDTDILDVENQCNKAITNLCDNSKLNTQITSLQEQYRVNDKNIIQAQADMKNLLLLQEWMKQITKYSTPQEAEAKINIEMKKYELEGYQAGINTCLFTSRKTSGVNEYGKAQNSIENQTNQKLARTVCKLFDSLVSEKYRKNSRGNTKSVYSSLIHARNNLNQGKTSPLTQSTEAGELLAVLNKINTLNAEELNSVLGSQGTLTETDVQDVIQQVNAYFQKRSGNSLQDVVNNLKKRAQLQSVSNLIKENQGTSAADLQEKINTILQKWSTKTQQNIQNIPLLFEYIQKTQNNNNDIQNTQIPNLEKKKCTPAQAVSMIKNEPGLLYGYKKVKSASTIKNTPTYKEASMSFNNDVNGSSFNMNSGPWNVNFENNFNVSSALLNLENNMKVKDIFSPNIGTNISYNNGFQSGNMQFSNNNFESNSFIGGNTLLGDNILAGAFSHTQKSNINNSSQTTQGATFTPNISSPIPVTFLATDTQKQGDTEMFNESSLYNNMNTGKNTQTNNNSSIKKSSIQSTGAGVTFQNGSNAFITKTQDNNGDTGYGGAIHFQGDNDMTMDYEGVTTNGNSAHNITISKDNYILNAYKDSLDNDNSSQLSLTKHMKNKFVNWLVKVNMTKDAQNKKRLGVFAGMNMALGKTSSSKRKTSSSKNRVSNSLRATVAGTDDNISPHSEEVQSCKLEAISLKTSIISAESSQPEIRTNTDWKSFKNSMVTSKMKAVAVLKKIKDEDRFNTQKEYFITQLRGDIDTLSSSTCNKENEKVRLAQIKVLQEFIEKIEALNYCKKSVVAVVAKAKSNTMGYIGKGAAAIGGIWGLSKLGSKKESKEETPAPTPEPAPETFKPVSLPSLKGKTGAANSSISFDIPEATGGNPKNQILYSASLSNGDPLPFYINFNTLTRTFDAALLDTFMIKDSNGNIVPTKTIDITVHADEETNTIPRTNVSNSSKSLQLTIQ